MALSKPGSAKSSAMNLHQGSELNFKQSPQPEPKYKRNTQSAGLIKSVNPCKVFARSKIRTIFFGEFDDPKTYSPSPPPPPSIDNLVVISETKGQLISIVQIYVIIACKFIATKPNTLLFGNMHSIATASRLAETMLSTCWISKR